MIMDLPRRARFDELKEQVQAVRSAWRFVVPLVVWLVLASAPKPSGLTPAG
jgi:hypothetical protein